MELLGPEYRFRWPGGPAARRWQATLRSAHAGERYTFPRPRAYRPRLAEELGLRRKLANADPSAWNGLWRTPVPLRVRQCAHQQAEDDPGASGLRELLALHRPSCRRSGRSTDSRPDYCEFLCGLGPWRTLNPPPIADGHDRMRQRSGTSAQYKRLLRPRARAQWKAQSPRRSGAGTGRSLIADEKIDKLCRPMVGRLSKVRLADDENASAKRS